MGKNSRDVELTVRAKNEATKTITSVAEALELLEKAQEDVSRSASKTSGFVEKLGAELNRLNAEAKGLEALGKIASNLDSAQSSVARLESSLAKSNDELKQFADESGKTAANLDKLKSGLAAVRDAFEKEKKAAADSKTEKSKINAELRKAENAYASLTAKIKAAKAPNQELAEAFIEQENALAILRNKQQRAIDSFDRQSKATLEAKKFLAAYEQSIRSAAERQQVLKESSDKTAASIERQGKALTEARSNLSEITATAAKVSAALGGVAVSNEAITAASKTTADAIGQVNKALAAQANISGGSGAAAQTQSLLQASKAVRAAREEYKQLSAEATRLGAELAKTANPSSQLRQQFLLAVQAASQSKAAYFQQAAALRQVSDATQKAAAALAARTAKAQQAAEAERKLAQAAQASGGFLAQLARALLGVNAAANQTAGSTTRLKGALSSVYGEGRQALSFFQRLRGELLGLTTQFVGFYAAVQSTGGVVRAYQTIEAAQNRLGAVFDQDGGKVAAELKFLEGTASRLGIEFGVLADEYAKFAIAADAANFTNEATRKIFLSVAEAARVNKLSLENTKGVFLALQQIISKGKVSSEELRRQLGDRLPGAFNIFADALGVTTAELDKALQQGEVFASQSTLLKFADQLTDRFGGQLPLALQSVTTEIGKFQNNLFQAQAQVANGGFIDAFKNALVDLNKFFQSKDGVQFFTQIGAALGTIVDLAAVVIRNFDLLGKVIRVIVAYKLAQVFTQGAVSLLTFSANAGTAGRSLTSFRGNALAAAAGVNAMTNSLRGLGFAGVANGFRSMAAGLLTATRGVAVLRVGFTALAGGARLLMGALGGPIGLLITLGTIIATEVFASYATDVDTATDALAEHERIMRAVAEAYGDVNAKIDDQGKKLQSVSISQARDNVLALRNSYADVSKEIQKLNTLPFNPVSSGKGGFNQPISGQEAEIRALVKQFKDGQLSIDAFDKQFAELNKTLDDPAAQQYARKVDELFQKLRAGKINLEDASRLANQLGVELQGLDADAAAADKRLASMKETTEKFVTPLTNVKAGTDAFNKALLELQTGMPGVEEALKKLKVLDEIEEKFRAAAAQAQTMSQVFQALSNADNAKFLAGIQSQSGFSGKATELIKGFEGFRSTPYFDVNALRGGFGSDTVTLADGSIRKVVAGMKISVEDGTRDLARRIGEFAGVVQGQVGADRFGALNADQQAALTSIAYNYGSLPERLVAAIKTGNTDSIVSTIRSLGSDNNGQNNKRRNQEADLFASGGRGLDDAVITENLRAQNQLLEDQQKLKEKTAEDAKREAERVAEEQAKARANFAEQIDQNKFEVANLQESARQQFINNQLRQQELKYKQAGLVLSDQEKQKIIESAGAVFDKQNAEKSAGDEKKRIEESVNQLIEYRKELLEQIAFAEQAGDQSKVADLKVKLEETNVELQSAIANAQQFYATMGGAEADLATLKLDGVKNSIQTVKQGFIDAKQVNDLFINGLSTAFSSVAESIAGVIDGTLSLKDGIKAVGQAFLKFAADFLLQIGQMIVKQALLNALGGAGGSGGGGIGGFLSGLFHAGGVVGSPGGRTRLSSPAWFMNAPRLHEGGVPGLKRNEVPAILENDEEVLTANDPRHVMNGGLSGGSPSVKIVNAFDGASFLEEGMNSPVGEKAFMNFVRSNSRAIKSTLES